MNPQDDPEARIRELEQPSIDVARASELGQTQSGPEYGYVPSGAGYHPPPPGAHPPPTMPYPDSYPGDVVFTGGTPPSRSSRTVLVVSVVVAVFALLVAGGVTVFMMARSVDRPSVSGGGATLTERPYVPPTSGGRISRPSTSASAPSPSSETPPPGSRVDVAGMGRNETIACTDNVVNVSGFENTVVLTGRCQSVSVSGKDNVVTVDESPVIGVSGFDNRIVFRIGEPEVTNSGFGNTVDRG